MRRAAIAVTALAVSAFALAGCSSSPDQVTASMQSPPRPEASSELAPEDDLSGSMDEFAEEFGEMPNMDEFSDEMDEFSDGIDDMLEQFETELGVGGECLDLLLTYSELMAGAFGMAPAGDRAATVAELRAALPSDLHDELDVVVGALEAVEGQGFSGTGALADPAFISANDDIVAWLTDCAPAGSAPGEGS